MTEVNENREQLQIYKEKLSELCQQNEDLLAKNQTLQTEKDALQSDNQNLNALCKTLLEGSGTPDSNLPVPTDRKDREASLLPLQKASKRRILFPLTALLAFVAIIAAVGFYIQMNRFEDSYRSAQASLKRTENELTETKNALEEVQSTLTEAQEALAETQDTLTERESTLTQLYSGLSEACEEDFGYYSSSFRIDETYINGGVVVLPVGQTKTLEVYNRYSRMTAGASDEEAINVEVQNSMGHSPEVNITARQPGIYTVRCNTYFLSYPWGSFNLLVIVPEEGMLPEISDMEEGPLSETLGAGGATT